MQAREPVPSKLKSGCKHRLEFAANLLAYNKGTSEPGEFGDWYWKRVLLKWPSTYKLDDICE